MRMRAGGGIVVSLLLFFLHLRFPEGGEYKKRKRGIC